MLRHPSSSMLRFEDALARILALVSPLSSAGETIGLEDADGRVLAADLVAQNELPSAEMRGGDGYAATARIGRGEELARGAIALPRGTRLRPAHLSLAASLGVRGLTVSPRPVVTVLAVGEGTPESLAFSLRASARRAGANVRAWPALAAEGAERALANALAQSDVVVTTATLARASEVRGALLALGTSVETWRIAIKPGTLLGVGTLPREGRPDAIVLSLGDNPASALVSFALFGVPLLRALQGDLRPFPSFARGRLTRAHAHDTGLLELARATVGQAEQGYTVTTLGSQAGGGILSMARADALVCIAENVTGAHADDDVDVLLLSDLAH